MTLYTTLYPSVTFWNVSDEAKTKLWVKLRSMTIARRRFHESALRIQ